MRRLWLGLKGRPKGGHPHASVGLAFVGVLRRVCVERSLTTGVAEVVGLTFVLALDLRRFFVDVHAADRVFGHASPPVFRFCALGTQTPPEGVWVYYSRAVGRAYGSGKTGIWRGNRADEPGD